MPNVKRKCRVCGKEYEACRTPKKGLGFQWREVACSPECGEIYLSMVMEARRPAPVSKQKPQRHKDPISPIETESITVPDESAEDSSLF